MKAAHKKKEIMTTEQNEEGKKLKDRRKQEGKYIWKKHHRNIRIEHGGEQCEKERQHHYGHDN